MRLIGKIGKHWINLLIILLWSQCLVLNSINIHTYIQSILIICRVMFYKFAANAPRGNIALGS